MDKLINWLFQRTVDGVTYLQIIIIATFLILLAYCFVDTYKEIQKIMGKAVEEENGENEKSM